MGVRFPYIGPYFREIGLSGTQIGMLGLVQPAIALLTLAPLGLIYDRLGGGGRFPAMLAFAGALAFLAVPCFTSFAGIFAVITLLSLVGMAIIPIMDSSAFIHLKNMPRGTSFGSLRVAGTISFGITCYLLGRVIDHGAPEFLRHFPAHAAITPDKAGYLMIFPAYVLLGLVVAAFFLKLPKTAMREKTAAGLASLFKNKLFLLFLVAAFFARLGESAAQRFLSIYFNDLGASATVISYSWLVSITGEAAIMLASARIIRHIGVRKLIAIGIGASIVRWGLLGFVTSIPLAIAIQSLHALTFGAFFIGAVTFVDRNAPAHRKASAMTLYWMVPCLAQIIGNISAGLIYDHLGVSKIFTFAAAGGVIAFFVFLPVVFAKPKT